MMNRQRIMRELIRFAEQGPALSLYNDGPAGLSPADRRQIEGLMKSQFNVWSKTWVLPLLRQVQQSWCPDKSGGTQKGR